jgi:hypothetical protein
LNQKSNKSLEELNIKVKLNRLSLKRRKFGGREKKKIISWSKKWCGLADNKK